MAIALPFQKFSKDGTEVAVKASSATKISETKRIKAKFEQPSA